VERPGRTFELWLLALGLLGFSLAGWLRLQFVLSAWQFLEQTGVQPGPPYQAIMGGLWGAGGLICAAGLLLRQRWAPAATRWTALAMAGWFWVDYLALTRDPGAKENWPFLLAVTLLALVYTFAVLSLDRQKQFFSASY
jgi:hypothetical protein